MNADERDRAQRRWLDGLARIENKAARELRLSLKDAEASVVKKAERQVREALASPDPLTAIVLALPSMSREVEYAFGGAARAEEVMAEAAQSGFLFGTREGRQRSSTVLKAKAPPVPPDEVARQRRNERDGARTYAGAWQKENGRAAARAVSRGAVADVAAGTSTLGIGVAAALSHRSLYAARNVVADAGRSGLFSAFGSAGMGAWTWHAEFGACEWCWSRSGLSFPAYEKFRSHPNCKCSAVPSVTVGSGGYDADALFSALPASQQVRVLGPGKQALYSQGKFSIRDVGKPGGRTRTLAELR